jgi:class 3 adenylate cyclase
MGNKDYTESTALGETPNIAARLLALADANTLIIGSQTYQLVQEQFTCVSRGVRNLKGISTPVHVYQVIAGREA